MVRGDSVLSPCDLEEVSTAIAESKVPVLFPSNTDLDLFALPLPAGVIETDCLQLSLNSYRGILEHDVSDQVVVVRAGTRVSELNEALALHGQCLPLSQPSPDKAAALASFDVDLANAIGYNLPHDLADQCGSWRDWILGMKVVQADGTIANCGSKAVKNVAGYDAQKLMVGARHSLALVVEVTFRTFPLKALPAPQTTFTKGRSGRTANWIQRVQRTDFDAAAAGLGAALLASDLASSTLWANAPTDGALKRFQWDWLIRSGCGDRNLEFTNQVTRSLMLRAKDLFDPEHKLNPGGFGLF